MEQLLLRLALSAGFLSAAASRLGLWGSHSSGWDKFVSYTAQVCAWAPASAVSFLAITATALEVLLALLLLAGFMTKWAAIGTAILTLLFAVSMTYSQGIKEPLDYSVFVFSAAGLLLSTVKDYSWSLDHLLKN